MSLAEDTSGHYSVPPVERAFKVLRQIASGDEMRNIARSARTTGLSRTTLIRLLATLEAERMIERTRDGEGFRLGLGLAGLAAQALFSADIVELAEPLLADLADTLGLSAHLGVLDERDVLYLARRTPNLHLVSNVRIGSRLPAHATTLGRVLLANRSDADVERLYAGRTLAAVTDKTPTTLQALHAQRRADQDAGVAWSSSNFEIGISSVAAPVFDHAGACIAAINVTGPARNVEAGRERLHTIERALRTAAATLSSRLGYVTASSSDPRRIDHTSRKSPS